MSRFVIAFLLPKNLEVPLNQVREHFEPGVSRKIPPHLSVSYPFFFEERGKLDAKLSQITIGLPPVEITMIGLGVFEKESQGEIIYAKVHPKEKLVALFESLKKDALQNVLFDTSIFPSGEKPPYIPHVTLAMKANAESQKWIAVKLSFLFNASFILNNLALFSYKRGVDSWKLEKKFVLEPISKPFGIA